MTLANEPILSRTLLGPATVTETMKTSEVCFKSPNDSPLHSSKATSPTVVTADDFRGMLARSRFKSRITSSITLSRVPECRESAAPTIGMLEDVIADYQGHAPLPCSLKPDNKLRHDSRVSPVGHPARQPRLARGTVCHGTTPPNYSLETTAYHSMPSLQTWNRMTHIQTPAGGALSPHAASLLPSNMGSKHFSPGQPASTEDKIAWQYPPSSPPRVYRQRFRSSGATVPYFSPSRPSNLCVYNIGSPAPVPLRLDIPAPFSPMGPSTLDGLVDSPRDVRRKPQPLPDTFSHSAFLYGFLCPLLWFIGAAVICLRPVHVDSGDVEGREFGQEELTIALRNEELKWAYMCLAAILCVLLLVVAGIALYLILRAIKKM